MRILAFALAVGGLLLGWEQPLLAQERGVVILTPQDIEALPTEPVTYEDVEVPERRRDLPAYQDPRYRRLASDRLETFSTDGEFRRLLRDIQRIERRDRPRRYGLGPDGKPQIVVAMLQDAEPECSIPEDCPIEDEGGKIVVTGSRIQSQAMSMVTPVNVTNTQVAAVDEGDIIKLIGEYLLVLQDGRVFAIHYPTMTLTDRTDVYRKDKDGDPIGADWYDEMLVQGDQVIITAYSYNDDASEITVLRLSQETGKLEVRGVFLITSEDYYDVDNYATRIVGDRLVIHTPYEAEDLVSRDSRPVIRKWEPSEDFDADRARGRQMLSATDIYKPLFGVKEPWIHTVSICPLGRVESRGLECDSTAFMGSEDVEMYVSSEDVYLWNSAASFDDREWRDCEPGTPRADFGDVPPGVVYRIPISGSPTRVLGVRGFPFDQFSMDATNGRFRTLSRWYRLSCDDYEAPTESALLDVSDSQFRDRYVAARPDDFVPLPPTRGSKVENRFSGEWLVYGARNRWSRRPPRDEEGSMEARKTVLHAVPLDDPASPTTVSIGHSLIRLERVGPADVIANGYVDEGGLRSTYVGLEGTPSVRSSAFLPGRYESESRSHAFNATIDIKGNGMLGVPTVTREEQSGGWWWYSDVSDLSFLSFNDAGELSDAGQLLATPEEDVVTAEGYECEVSCIDWYGNARPIFLGGKVYGLMATELVEAEVVTGRVAERRRVDLTGPIQR